MATIDLTAQNLTREAIYQAAGAAQVTFERLDPKSGATTASATVTALIKGYLPDTTAAAQAGYGASQPGAITLGERMFLVMAGDLANAGFPLPLKKGDKLISADTGEKLTLTRADPYKRSIAGAIEGFAVTP